MLAALEAEYAQMLAERDALHERKAKANRDIAGLRAEGLLGEAERRARRAELERARDELKVSVKRLEAAA